MKPHRPACGPWRSQLHFRITQPNDRAFPGGKGAWAGLCSEASVPYRALGVVGIFTTQGTAFKDPTHKPFRAGVSRPGGKWPRKQLVFRPLAIQAAETWGSGAQNPGKDCAGGIGVGCGRGTALGEHSECPAENSGTLRWFREEGAGKSRNYQLPTAGSEPRVSTHTWEHQCARRGQKP